MTRTQEIARLLNITEDQAEEVRDEMDMSGLDYSECTQAEFDACAKSALTVLVVSGKLVATSNKENKMTTSQIKGMLRFHKSAYRAYKASGQKEMAAQARAKMLEMYSALRSAR